MGGVDVFFDLGTRWRWLPIFTSRPLYPQDKTPLYPLVRRLGGLQSRSGHDVEEENSQPPPGIEPRSSDRPARSQLLVIFMYIFCKEIHNEIGFVKERIQTIKTFIYTVQCRHCKKRKLFWIQYLAYTLIYNHRECEQENYWFSEGLWQLLILYSSDRCGIAILWYNVSGDGSTPVFRCLVVNTLTGC